MKIVVVSDNHTMRCVLTDIVSMHPDDDLYVHLGDSEFDATNRELKEYIKIKGNCDFKTGFLNTYKESGILMTHGHMYQVNINRNTLAQKAIQEACNVVLYGHTHIKHVEQLDGVICINPGSIAQSRNNEEETYAVLEMDKSLKITFYNAIHNIVEETEVTI